MNKIDKNIFYLGLVSFFTDMASSIVTTLLPIFIVFVLNEGVDKLGIVIAVSIFVSYIFRLLFGYLSERYDARKPFLIIGYGISALSKPLLAMTHTYTQIALLRALERMGKAVRSAPKDALISVYSKNNQSGRTFGFHKMMDVSGELSGALIVMAVFYLFTQNEGLFRTLFTATLLPGLLGLIVLIFFVQEKPSEEDKSKTRKVFVRSDLQLLWLLFIYFFFLLFFMGDQYFLVAAKQSGMSLSVLPILVIVATLTQVLISYFSGMLIDKVGHKHMLFTAFVSAIGSTLCIEKGYFFAGFALLGMFSVVSLNSMRSFISANASSKAFIYGIFYMGVAVFSSSGALLMGKVWHYFGFEKSIFLSLYGMGAISFVLLINIIFSFFSNRNKNY